MQAPWFGLRLQAADVVEQRRPEAAAEGAYQADHQAHAALEEKRADSSATTATAHHSAELVPFCSNVSRLLPRVLAADKGTFRWLTLLQWWI